MMDHAVINNAFSPSSSKKNALNDLPVDAHLPQLPIILDEAVMREKLQDRMFASANDRTLCVIRQCEIIQVRYKPTSSCMVSYRLDIENVATGERGEQILCGRAFSKGRSQPQWEKASTRALVHPRFGIPLIHLPEVETVLWSFPNDRKMHTLPGAANAAHSTSAIPPSWLLSHLGTGWQVANTRSRVMHYVGEHTCTVQTSFELIHPSLNTRQPLTLFSKTYYNEEGVQTDRVMRQLWDSTPRRSGQLRMAQPLWYDARLKTLWQLGIHGSTLENHAIETPTGVPLLAQAARTVATFHTTPVSNLSRRTELELIGKLDAVASILMQCRPSCRAILSPLRDRLIAQANTISVGPTATLHGDLHMKNLFLTHDKIALIDLDNVCQGHPGQDIGSFVAGLLTGALAKPMPLSQMAGPVQAFVNQYDQCTSWNLDQPTLAWFTAMALVTERASRCVTRLKDGRVAMIEPLLNLAYDISKAGSLLAPIGELTANCERNGGQ
jgi:Phosphotransferase enzyme family